MCGLRLALATVCTFASASVWCAPFVLNDAQVGTHSKLEAEFDWSGTPDADVWTVPELKFAVPVIPHRWEVKLTGSYRHTDGAGVPDQRGIGDSGIETKWAFAAQRDGSPVDLAVEPELHVPTGDAGRGLGHGAASLELPLMVGRSFGPAALTWQVDYTHGFGSLADQLLTGVLGTVDLPHRFEVGAEVYAERTLDAGADTDLDVNVGFNWRAARHWEFAALVGRSVQQNEKRGIVVAEYLF